MTHVIIGDFWGIDPALVETTLALSPRGLSAGCTWRGWDFVVGMHEFLGRSR